MTRPLGNPDGTAVATVPASVTVTFQESECVTTAGTKKVTYLFLLDSEWLPPERAPGARVEQLSRIPQVIWRREITVELAVGTTVERIVVSPKRGQASTADVLLGKAKGLSLVTRRSTFRVGRRGELVST